MPQMSPMWWEILFMLFNLMLLMTNIIIFWNMKSNTINCKIKLIKPKYNWKW